MSHDDRPNVSIWGTILSCTEIGLNIYQIVAEKKKGLMIPTEKADEILSPETVALGEAADGYVHFAEGGMGEVAVAHELVQGSHITNPEFFDQFGRPEQIEAEAQMFLPERFGSLPAIEEIPSVWGKMKEQALIDNGIYFFQGETGSGIAVHDTLAGYCMSDYARGEYHWRKDNYRYYELNRGAAIAIQELSASHPKVLDLIVSEDSLMHTLATEFSDYTSYWNHYADADLLIADRPAPPFMFLQQHLDEAAQNPAPELAGEIEEAGQEDDFFERSDPFDEPEI